MTFNVGDKVRLSAEWGKHCQYHPPKHNPVGKQGTVLGHSRTTNCTRIVFDGQITPQTFHNTFLEKAS